MKKLLLTLFIGMFLISCVSAFEFDNVKHYDKIEKEITITNAFGIGNKLAEYTLTKNTDQCLINCYSEGTAKLYSEGYLFSDLNFKNRENDFVNLNNKILIEVTEEYEIDVTDYNEVCSKTINGTSCNNEISGTHKETKSRTYWKEYDNQILDEGNYKWRIEGTKEPEKDVDWIGSAFGEDFTEWAWWSSSWGSKKQINITDSRGYDLINYTMIFNVTYDSDMNNDFSDLRFTNPAEDTELGYWIESKDDGVEAIVYVLVPSLTASSITSIYMYYENNGASSTNNVSDAFLWNEEFGGDYDSGDYTVAGSPTISGGVAYFDTASHSLRFGSTLANPNSDLMIDVNVKYVEVNSNYAIWGLGRAYGIYTDDVGLISRDGSGSTLEITMMEIDTDETNYISSTINNAHTDYKEYKMFVAFNSSLAHNLTNVENILLLYLDQ